MPENRVLEHLVYCCPFCCPGLSLYATEHAVVSTAVLNAGAVVQKRSPWRVSIIVDFFLAIVNLVVVL